MEEVVFFQNPYLEFVGGYSTLYRLGKEEKKKKMRKYFIRKSLIY